MLLHGEANTLVIRASSDTLSPRHARHPIQRHEAAKYLHNRYRYLKLAVESRHRPITKMGLIAIFSPLVSSSLCAYSVNSVSLWWISR